MLARVSLVALLAVAACSTGATADAGGRDDATLDAGSDLGGPDLGGPDLGAPDLGAPDLGAPDLGAPDLGAPDLGPPLPVGTPLVHDVFALDVVVDDTTVYWDGRLHTTGGVFSVPRAGGGVTTLVDGGQTHALLEDGDTLYFFDGNPIEIVDGALRSVAKTGGTVTTLADAETTPRSLVLDGTTLFWTTLHGVRALDLPAGAARDVVALDGARALAVDVATHTLVVESTFGIVAMPEDGSTMRTLSPAFVEDLLVSGTDVLYGEHLGEMYRVPLDGSAAPVALTTLAEVEGEITTDGAFVYFASGGVTGDFTGTVRRVPIAGGATVTLPGTTEHLEYPLTHAALGATELWLGVDANVPPFGEGQLVVLTPR